MNTAIITGSAGLIGSAAARYYAAREFRVVGIDNDCRRVFFGDAASTAASRQSLELLPCYIHMGQDIRDSGAIDAVLESYGPEVKVVIHTAAQPSHDWAAGAPHTDFSINATGTLNLLEATRRHCQYAAFIFTSTNKVYGDTPNRIKFRETESRVEPNPWGTERGLQMTFADRGWTGFSEELSIDQSTHSLFGVSKLAADLMVQEYGRYFGMNTVAFRCGCLTGPAHAGTKQHGFLSYLVKCAMMGTPYTVIGHHGKQVRDNLHADDVVSAFDCYLKSPRPGAVYNLGGGRENSCSVREAIQLVERVSGRKMQIEYQDEPRVGDHKWWITDTRKFQADYPAWRVTRGLEDIVREMANEST